MKLLVDDLGFAYPGQEPLFSGLSLELAGGERLALAGPSGAGKSTLCKLLAGYLLASCGSISLTDLPARAEQPHPRPAARPAAANPIQLIWQHPEQAFDPRARLRLALAETAASPHRLEQLRQALAIQEQWLSRYPHELSGGELQRLSILRALATRPAVLICDEVSTMLDAVTQARIWQVILTEQDSQGFGLLFVSHSAALTARLATRSYTM